MDTLEWQAQMSQGRLLQSEAPALAAIHFQLALELVPGNAEVQLALGQALLAAEDAEAALPYFSALAQDPATGPEPLFCQALAQEQLGDAAAAIATLRATLRRYAGFAPARLALARLETAAAQLPAAIENYRQYLQLRPNDLTAGTQLAEALIETGARVEAEQLLMSIYRQEPENSDVLMRWLYLKAQDDPQLMIQLLIQLTVEEPALLSHVAVQMASLMEYLSEPQERQRCLQLALEDANLPDRPAWLLRYSLNMPQLPGSRAEIQQALTQLDQQLTQFESALPAGAGVLPDFSNLQPYLRTWLPFCVMSYLNVEMLSRRRRWAKLFVRMLPERPSALQRTGPLRIGFVLQQNTAVHAFLLELLRRWPAGHGQVVIFLVGGGQTPWPTLREDFEQMVLPVAPEQIIERIERSRLDLLFLSEILTDHLIQTLLACYRFAPVQATSWLSSGSTGLPEMDYFISSKLLEQSEQPQRFYDEQLILLDELPTYLLPRMLLDEPPTRADYGLPEGPLYLCPHLIFKLHPDFEAVLGEILERDPAGQLVLISHPNNRFLRNKLLARLEQRFPQLMPRIWFLPKLSHQEYLGLLTLGDVMLDPFYFGGGTTSFEALGLGLPIVTWPGERLHGRITYAYYRLMDVLDCVAFSQQDYVRLAVELAHRQDLNAAVRQRILAARERLFERLPAVEEFAACLLRLAEQGRLQSAAAKIS